MLVDAKGVKLTLFLRNAKKLHGNALANARIVEGDVLDRQLLSSVTPRSASLPPFRRAADAIEASGLDYTVLRPAWLTDEDEVGEPFKGTHVIPPCRAPWPVLLTSLLTDC